MNKREAKKIEKQLEDELARITGHIRNLEESAFCDTPVSESAGDLSSYAEAGTDNFERETALNIATTESQRARDIVEALQRVKLGTYGVCESCEEEIPKKRLEVFASARYCVKCQSRLEKEGAL